MNGNAEKKKNKVRRKQYFVDSKLQLSILGLFFGLALFLAGTFFVSYKNLMSNIVSDLAVAENHSTRFLLDAISRQEIVTQRFLIFAFLLVIAYFLVIALLVSHQIAGPIFVIRRYIRQMVNREKPIPLQLRRYDFFRDIAQDLNELNSRLEKSDEKK